MSRGNSEAEDLYRSFYRNIEARSVPLSFFGEILEHAVSSEATNLFVRNVDSAVAERIREAASMRQITIGEYLGRLVELHRVMVRGQLEFDRPWTPEHLLVELGLEPVREGE